MKGVYMAFGHKDVKDEPQPQAPKRAKVDYSAPLVINIAMDDKEKANQRLYMSLVAPNLSLSPDILNKNLQTNPALIDQLNAAGRYCYSNNDASTAKAYFEKAKELGSGYACFCLGYIFQHASPPEEKRAIENYNDAIKLKELNALVNLGVIYHRSKVKKQEAQECFRKAAEQHVPEGCYNLALQEEMPVTRMKLFKEAADGRVTEALVHLGELHENNELKSTDFYIKATLNGHPEGLARLMFG
jgi:TPR repeat protein